MGRPSKYKKEYCDKLIDHMKQGLSFESFAGVVGTCKQTIYTWTENHAEFLDAKKRGSALSQLTWEKMGIAGAAGKIAGFNATSWIFNMKNRCDWRDKKEVEADINITKAIVEFV
jgi:hypothetical protein